MFSVAPPKVFVPRVGALLTVSAKAKPGSYLLPSSGLRAAMTIRGKGVTIDFAGATLKGSPAEVAPDARGGLGILVEGENVTIRNLKARGYKIALMAKGVKGLKLVDCDLSYNWKQHLRSTPEREDVADWMSFHHNEKGEWLDQGVAAYLDHCEGFEVKRLKVTGGQSGLFLDRSNHGLVWNSNLSYNSALGIGMYRASDNRIMHNRVDYDVRGFSYGVYNRGQDSAGILVFEQCNRNVFAYNSVTHGGDGFFLWAGQQTMDSGEGGCNDNLCYANDFSYAPTNGIEATFSRNRFIGNRVHGSFHGFWGGFSYDTKVIGNDFAGNQRGIAVEHGQTNDFSANTFDGEDVAIALWGDPVDPAFAYAKARDVESRDTLISGNLFRDVALALDLKGTVNTRLADNLLDGAKQAVRRVGDPFSAVPVTNTLAGSTPEEGLPGSVRHIRIQRSLIYWDPLHLAPETKPYRVAPMPGGRMPFLSSGTAQGWATILVDEWGPYDSRRPLLWPEKKVDGGAPLPGGTSAGSGLRKAGVVRETGRYQVLGPKGRWRLVSAQGVRMGATSGTVPGVVKIDVPKGKVGTVKVEMEYIGGPTTDIRGVETAMGKPVRFGFSKFFAPIDWDVKFYGWKENENPADPHSNPKDFEAVLRTAPIASTKVDQLDFAGYGFLKGMPTNHYATLAEGVFEVPQGEYAVELTTDDGAKVWVDGKLIVADAWHYQGPTLYSQKVRLSVGRHRIRVEHFQIDGYSALKLSLKPST